MYVRNVAMESRSRKMDDDYRDHRGRYGDDRRLNDPRDSRDLRDSRDYRDSRDLRDSRDIRDSRDHRDSRDSRMGPHGKQYWAPAPRFMKHGDLGRPKESGKVNSDNWRSSRTVGDRRDNRHGDHVTASGSISSDSQNATTAVIGGGSSIFRPGSSTESERSQSCDGTKLDEDINNRMENRSDPDLRNCGPDQTRRSTSPRRQLATQRYSDDGGRRYVSEHKYEQRPIAKDGYNLGGRNEPKKYPVNESPYSSKSPPLLNKGSISTSNKVEANRSNQITPPIQVLQKPAPAKTPESVDAKSQSPKPVAVTVMKTSTASSSTNVVSTVSTSITTSLASVTTVQVPYVPAAPTNVRPIRAAYGPPATKSAFGEVLAKQVQLSPQPVVEKKTEVVEEKSQPKTEASISSAVNIIAPSAIPSAETKTNDNQKDKSSVESVQTSSVSPKITATSASTTSTAPIVSERKSSRNFLNVIETRVTPYIPQGNSERWDTLADMQEQGIPPFSSHIDDRFLSQIDRRSKISPMNDFDRRHNYHQQPPHHYNVNMDYYHHQPGQQQYPSPKNSRRPTSNAKYPTSSKSSDYRGGSGGGNYRDSGFKGNRNERQIGGGTGRQIYNSGSANLGYNKLDGSKSMGGGKTYSNEYHKPASHPPPPQLSSNQDDSVQIAHQMTRMSIDAERKLGGTGDCHRKNSFGSKASHYEEDNNYRKRSDSNAINKTRKKEVS